MPNIDAGYSSEELFSRFKSTHVELNRVRFWETICAFLTQYYKTVRRSQNGKRDLPLVRLLGSLRTTSLQLVLL